MKARLLREEDCRPSAEYPGVWRCRACNASGSGPKLSRCPKCTSVVGQRTGTMPAGTVIDNPDAWKLVLMGVAVPEDEECKERAGLNAAELAVRQAAQERVRLGIAPGDYQAFDDGLMVGYNPDDGSWKPGPNYDEAAWQERKQNSPIIIVEDE